MEKAASLFPYSAEIVEVHVKALRKEKDYLKAFRDCTGKHAIPENRKKERYLKSLQPRRKHQGNL